MRATDGAAPENLRRRPLLFALWPLLVPAAALGAVALLGSALLVARAGWERSADVVQFAGLGTASAEGMEAIAASSRAAPLGAIAALLLTVGLALDAHRCLKSPGRGRSEAAEGLLVLSAVVAFALYAAAAAGAFAEVPLLVDVTYEDGPREKHYAGRLVAQDHVYVILATDDGGLVALPEDKTGFNF